jgi:hypothetical protein
MLRYLEGLYETDARGRILRVRAPDRREAPRFHLARTPAGNLWRFRADLRADLVRRLATLAAKEAPLVERAAGAPPEREEFIRRALESAAPIESVWSGLAFGVVEPLRGPPVSLPRVRALGPEDVDRLAPGLGPLPVPLARGGCFGALAQGHVVAVCCCARGDGSGPSAAVVVTAPAYRGRGHGLAVLRTWCLWVRSRGGEAYLTASWRDAASRALASRLGLVPIGEDRHWR